jgi:hypothetical protein
MVALSSALVVTLSNSRLLRLHLAEKASFKISQPGLIGSPVRQKSNPARKASWIKQIAADN